MSYKRLLTVGVTGITVGFLPAKLGAQWQKIAEAPAHGAYTAIVDQSRTLIDSVMRARNIPGLSIAVSIDGNIVWSEGFGYANLEQRTPVTSTTEFRIGSISKSLTSAALGQLYEQGKLDLDAPVQRYVPSFPQKKKGAVTVRLVAGHLAGLRHYRADENFSSTRYDSVLEGLDIFKNDTLLTPPGTKFSYSSYGWNLLSAVVEGASGERFLPYMREHVFGPLGMRHTVADHTDSIIVGRTGFYIRTGDGSLINAPYVDNSYKWAGGGFLSTPEDLLKFANALLLPGFLERETVHLMWTSQKNAAGEDVGYGVGWFVGERDGTPAVWHGGGSVGGNSLLLILPGAKLVLALTTNITNAGFRGVPVRIAQKFAGM
ncbi:MAG: serine hydrolase domain-containing protein [Gemmatimonadales bacterium]